MEKQILENNIEAVINAGRGEFLATQSLRYDAIIKPYLIMIESLVKMLQNTKKPNHQRKAKLEKMKKQYKENNKVKKQSLKK